LLFLKGPRGIFVTGAGVDCFSTLKLPFLFLKGFLVILNFEVNQYFTANFNKNCHFKDYQKVFFVFF